MLKKELDCLSNNEKLVVIYWRIVEYPHQLNVEEIAIRLKLQPDFCLSAIKKFQRNARLKFELDSIKKEMRKAMELLYWDS